LIVLLDITGGCMAALSLPKSARLHRRAEFSRVRESGVSRVGKFLSMGGWIDPAGGQPRGGVITSRKVGNAVQRSRARRRLREIFRVHRPQLVAGLQMVMVAKRGAAAADFGSLREEWLRLALKNGFFAGSEVA
jgi:ribonuclease P protein component